MTSEKMETEETTSAKKVTKLSSKMNHQLKHSRDWHSGPFKMLGANNNGTLRIQKGIKHETINMQNVSPHHEQNNKQQIWQVQFFWIFFSPVVMGGCAVCSVLIPHSRFHSCAIHVHHATQLQSTVSQSTKALPLLQRLLEPLQSAAASQ